MTGSLAPDPTPPRNSSRKIVTRVAVVGGALVLDRWRMYRASRVIFFPAIFLALGLVACGGGGSTVTIHGQVEPGGGALASVGGGGLSQTYAGCASDTPSPGAQVVVTDSSGKVIGAGTLGAWSHKTATASGLTMYPCWMPFTMKNVPTESRYGFSVNNVPGKLWMTDVSHLVTLVAGSGG